MDTVFRLCVVLLNYMADLFGITYVQVNVIIFCLLMPLVFFIMLYIIIRQRAVIKKLNTQINENNT